MCSACQKYIWPIRWVVTAFDACPEALVASAVANGEREYAVLKEFREPRNMTNENMEDKEIIAKKNSMSIIWKYFGYKWDNTLQTGNLIYLI